MQKAFFRFQAGAPGVNAGPLRRETVKVAIAALVSNKVIIPKNVEYMNNAAAVLTMFILVLEAFIAAFSVSAGLVYSTTSATPTPTPAPNRTVSIVEQILRSNFASYITPDYWLRAVSASVAVGGLALVGIALVALKTRQWRIQQRVSFHARTLIASENDVNDQFHLSAVNVDERGIRDALLA